MSLAMFTKGVLWPKLSGRPLVVFNGEVYLVDDPLEVEVPLLTTVLVDTSLDIELLEDPDAEVDEQVDIDLLGEGE